MRIRSAWIVTGLILLASCSKHEEFSADDPLRYVQAKRPVAPYITTVAPTGSMEPEIHGGAVIAIDPIAIDKVKVGDNVAIWWASRKLVVLHKVVEIFHAGNGEIGLVTKGVANSFPDETNDLEHVTTAADLVGIVTVIKN